MQSHYVVFRVTCAADDPQAPSRVMGVFAARSLLPQRFVSILATTDCVEIEVAIFLLEGERTGPQHLARVIERFPVVSRVELTVDGVATPFTMGCEA